MIPDDLIVKKVFETPAQSFLRAAETTNSYSARLKSPGVLLFSTGRLKRKVYLAVIKGEETYLCDLRIGEDTLEGERERESKTWRVDNEITRLVELE